MYDYLKTMMRRPDLEKEFPVFQKIVDHVMAEPKVKAYVAKAPKSDV